MFTRVVGGWEFWSHLKSSSVIHISNI